MARNVVRIKHVLVADDSEGAAELLAEVLSLMVEVPITVGVAHDGEEAVAQAVAKPPAVALLDLDMPVMDGIDAATAIRAAYSGGLPPLLIAVTGNALWSRHKRAREVFDYVLAKPADVTQLARLIDGIPGSP